MAKKKQSTAKSPRSGFGFQAATLDKDLKKVKKHLKNNDIDSAVEVLNPILEQFPDHPDVLKTVADVALAVPDFVVVEKFCGLWLAQEGAEQRSDYADVLLMLSAGHFHNGRILLCLEVLKRLLEKFPDHPDRTKIQQQVDELQGKMDEVLSQTGLDGKDAADLARMSEKAQVYTDQEEYEQARSLMETLLQQRPNFVPAINNLGMIQNKLGNLNEALALADRALAIDSNNLHARFNQVCFLVRQGRMAEAARSAEILKALPITHVNDCQKQAEALSYLGDDAAVLQVFEQAETLGEELTPQLYHLAACAALRVGQADRARQLWEAALTLDPQMLIASANLDDCKALVSDRQGPYAFPLVDWMPQSAIVDLLSALFKDGDYEDPDLELSIDQAEDQAATEQACRDYIDRHPELISLVPILLKRGDPTGREFAMRLAFTAKTPEMLAALLDFAKDRWGPDDLRNKAAILLKEEGLISEDKLTLWMRGKWQEILMVSFEVFDGPVADMKPETQKLFNQALNILHQDDDDQEQANLKKAEALLKQAIDQDPDIPFIISYLISVYDMQDRKQAAKDLLRESCDRFPDDPMLQLNQVKYHLINDELDQAKDLLLPILKRTKFHVSVFSLLCDTYIEFLYRAHELGSARQWLGVWQNYVVENARIKFWREALHNEKPEQPIGLLL